MSAIRAERAPRAHDSRADTVGRGSRLRMSGEGGLAKAASRVGPHFHRSRARRSCWRPPPSSDRIMPGANELDTMPPVTL